MNTERARFIEKASNQIYRAAMSVGRDSRVPYAGVVFDKSEVKNALGSLYDAFVSRWFAIGRNASEFEKQFANYLGLTGSVLSNSGSSANLLAVAALIHLKRLQRNDEVITPATTFPTTLNPLLLYGLRPVLVDVDLPSYTISARAIKHAASSRTKGVMLPHLNGSASYMPEIMELADQKGWVVIEDCCDALGTTIDSRYAGTFGHVSTFSFYAAHHLCMGEGGAVASRDENILDTVRSLRDWGRGLGKEVFDVLKGRKISRVGKGSSLPEDYELRYTYVTQGFNLKPLDIQAAIGLAQLKKLSAFGRRRRANYARLYKKLSRYSDMLVLPKPATGVNPSWFVFPLVVKENVPFSRKDIVNHLEKDGIETRPILAGNIVRQPAYSESSFRIPQKLSNSELILRNGFFIGTFPGLSAKQIEKVVSAFTSFMNANRS